MKRFYDLSIRHKLTFVTALASGTALLLASLAFLLFDRASFEDALVRRLRTVGEVTAWNGAPAVVFRDPESARTTLGALASEREVVYAAFYDRDGKLFVYYARADAASVSPPASLPAGDAEAPAHAFRQDVLDVRSPVFLNDERVGTLVIRSGLRERSERGLRFAMIAVAVFGASLLLALLVGRIVQRFVSEPILQLARTARRVSLGELSARGQARGRDEVGELVDSWNGMLDGLERRDEDLRRTHAELERRIDEGVELYRKAEEANRLKDEFLATLSHELRTPLNAIVGWAEILRSEADTAIAKKAAETISRNALTQGQLIADILDMQRISTGKLSLSLAPLELAPVVEAGVDTLRPAAAAKSIAIETAIEPGDASVLGDRERLQQVVWNLVSNAVKFAPNAGQVLVRLAGDEAHVELTVADNGPGLSPEFIPYAFDRFRQADASSTRRHGGLGLGLAIVKSLVELHGGSVSARNRVDGQGALFTVRLPRAAPGASLGEVPRDSSDHVVPLDGAPSLEGVRVLLVEDDPDSREIAAAVLRRCGAEVATVAAAAEGFELLRRDRPNVLLSDLAMPGEDGLSLMRRVRQLPQSEGGLTPAAALTARASAEERIQALAAGFQIHIAKPVQPAELVTVVASLAGGARIEWRKSE